MISKLHTALAFFTKLEVSSLTKDPIVLEALPHQEFVSSGVGLRFLVQFLANTPKKLQRGYDEMMRMFDFYEKHYEVCLKEETSEESVAFGASSTQPRAKPVKKQFELRSRTQRRSPLAFLDDLIVEYMRVNFRALNAKDLFEFDYEVEEELKQEPAAVATHFIRVLFHSTFFVLFADAAVIMSTMKPIRYFYNPRNAEEYYNKLGRVPSLKDKFFKSFNKDTIGMLKRSKLYLGTEQFKTGAAKILPRFGELTETMTRLDPYLPDLFEAFPYDEFHLEGLICKSASYDSLHHQVQHVSGGRRHTRRGPDLHRGFDQR